MTNCPICKQKRGAMYGCAKCGQLICVGCNRLADHLCPACQETTKKRYERDHSMLGRWQLFLRGDDADVILQRIVSDGYEERLVEHNFTPEGALKLLAWLSLHKDELSQATRKNEGEQ